MILEALGEFLVEPILRTDNILLGRMMNPFHKRIEVVLNHGDLLRIRLNTTIFNKFPDVQTNEGSQYRKFKSFNFWFQVETLSAEVFNVSDFVCEFMAPWYNNLPFISEEVIFKSVEFFVYDTNHQERLDYAAQEKQNILPLQPTEKAGVVFLLNPSRNKSGGEDPSKTGTYVSCLSSFQFETTHEMYGIIHTDFFFNLYFQRNKFSTNYCLIQKNLK